MSHLFEDIFDVIDIDPEGKKFDKVSRIIARSKIYELELHLDINTDVYPIELTEKFTLVLTNTLNIDGTPDSGQYDQGLEKGSLLDKYDYAMHGKVFKHTEENNPTPKLSIFVSFGGLLMMLKGDSKGLSAISVDSRIYLLMRKLD